MIQGDGSNGIAAITWEDVSLTKMNGRSSAGKPSVDISLKLRSIVVQTMSYAVQFSDKPYYIGRMIVADIRKAISPKIDNFFL